MPERNSRKRMIFGFSTFGAFLRMGDCRLVSPMRWALPTTAFFVVPSCRPISLVGRPSFHKRMSSATCVSVQSTAIFLGIFLSSRPSNGPDIGFISHFVGLGRFLPSAAPVSPAQRARILTAPDRLRQALRQKIVRSSSRAADIIGCDNTGDTEHGRWRKRRGELERNCGR